MKFGRSSPHSCRSLEKFQQLLSYQGFLASIGMTDAMVSTEPDTAQEAADFTQAVIDAH